MTTDQAIALEKKEMRDEQPPKESNVPLDDVALQQKGDPQAAEAPGNMANYGMVESEEEDVPMPKNVPLDDVALKEHGDVKAAMAPGDN